MGETLEQPTELLGRVRKSGGDISPFAAQIERAVTHREPTRPGAAEQSAPGQGIARAALLAYHEILHFDHTGNVQALAKSVPEATHQLNEIYMSALRFDVARALLEQYAARWPKARPLRVARPIMGNATGPADDFRDDKTKDVQIVSKSGAATTFVVFCGIRHAFGVQLNVLHHCCLAKHNVNVIYLRDYSQNLYLSGVESLGDAGQTANRLRNQFSLLNTRKLVFMGNSGGVFGALYYGARLDADLVLLFGGPSSLEVGMEESERQAYPRLQKLHEAGSVEWPNLRAIYTQNKKPVWFYFASENKVDRLQAENLADLGNVELRPVDSRHHFMVNLLAKSGELESVFSQAAARAGSEPITH